MGLKEEFCSYITRGGLRPREAAPRVLADIIFLNLALILASVVWFVIGAQLYAGQLIDKAHFAAFLCQYYLNNALSLTLISLLVFHWFGLYARTRRYRGRYKAWIILQAVTLSYLGFFFVNYYILKTPTMVRGVIAFGWLFTLFLVGGSRLFKVFLLSHFTIEPKYPAVRTRIETVLVIGGAGYMGSLTARMLLAKGYKVRVLDNLLYGNDESIKELYQHPDFEFVKGDLRDLTTMGEVMKGADAVIHLGAIVGDPASSLDEEFTNEVNTLATMMISKLCKLFR